MKKLQLNILVENILWMINPFLLVLIIFREHLIVNSWLLWLGQWHPIILHFPIVLGLTIALLLIINKTIIDPIIHVNAIVASLTSLAGLYIAKEGGYDTSILTMHLWGGVTLTYIAWLLVLINQRIPSFSSLLKKILGIAYLIVIIFFTHKGGQLTHGKDALTLPTNKPIEKEISKPDSLISVYEKAVHPILLNKCISCHGGDKIKGELQLTSIEMIKKGGKHGQQMEKRIHLPMADEKHMPPNDKTQLTKEELAILTRWLQLGGDLEKKLHALDKKDSLYILASQYIAPILVNTKEQVDLSEYNNDYVSVKYDYHGSDKINATFFRGAAYKTAFLKKIEKLKNQVISINMQNIPLEKEDVDLISQFKNVEKLNLNFTRLKWNQLQPLQNLSHLKMISLAGIEFSNSDLSNFIKKTKLNKIYLWSSTLKKEQISQVINANPNITFIIGDNLDGVAEKINKPIIEQDCTIITSTIQVPIKHYLKGTILKYTLDDSDPDSIASLTYIKPIILDKNTTLKTKAFKKGWISSDIVTKTFYKSTLNPDSIYLLTKPELKYQGKGGRTIIDHELGDLNFGNGKWLGYRFTDMEFIMSFKNATPLNEVIFNVLVNTPSYLFPVQTIKVEASEDGKTYHTIQSNDFTSITKAYNKETNITQTQPFKIKISKSKAYSFYKFTLKNLKKLPSWHSGKGTPAWLFIDEVFFN